MLGLIGDVFRDLVDARLTDGKCAVAGLPVELGERAALRFDPFRGRVGQPLNFRVADPLVYKGLGFELSSPLASRNRVQSFAMQEGEKFE